jgi:hypothetical protein
MISKKDLICYLKNDWHLVKSDAFIKCLVNPLSKMFNVTLKQFDFEDLLQQKEKIIIFLFIPTFLDNQECRTYITQNSNMNRYFWVPMWDWIHVWGVKEWELIPKNMGIICFCYKLYLFLKQIKRLRVLYLKFYHRPYDPVSYDHGVVLAYWNRTNLYSKEFLIELCKNLRATRFLYLDKLDPDYEKRFELPEKIENTKVVVYKNWANSEEYQHILSESNVFLCPRNVEGVGLSFIEQFSRGSVCFSVDHATMNEYIKHKCNGYLFSNLETNDVNWSEVRNLNLKKVSKQVRKDANIGYRIWVLYHQQRLFSFILQDVSHV